MKYLFFFLFIFCSCNEKQLNIENFDPDLWKSDPLGCKEIRPEQVNILIENKQQLMGLDSDELISILGKPDETELHTRNQKFYNYFISSGTQCNKNLNENPSKLVLRFNATGLVSEVSLYD